MIQNINGRLIFVYSARKISSNRLFKAKLRLSLLGILIGIFLLPQIAYQAGITPENLIDLTNQERAAQGLNTLTVNQLLTKAAIAKSQNIIQSQTFGHTIDNRKFSSWIRDTGYNYSYIGENLAIDFVTSEGIMQAWNNSALHKKNLLSPYYNEVGIAAIEGNFKGEKTTVVVQIFGAPATGSIQPLTTNSGLNYLSPGLTQSELNSFGAENSLTHSIANLKPLAFSNEKINLPDSNFSLSQTNKFFIQQNYLTLNNFILTFAAMILICLLIYLYYYYFLKINKLASI